MLLNVSFENKVVLALGNESPLLKSRIARLETEGAVVKRGSLKEALDQDWILTAGRSDVNFVVDAVFVSTSFSDPTNSNVLAQALSVQAAQHRVPINVADDGTLCSFAVLASHKDGDFELGITTNGQGCRLAGRIKRHIVHSLPPDLGQICSRVGDLRRKIQSYDNVCDSESSEDDSESSPQINSLVLESQAHLAESKRLRRMRWLNQVVEYYPFSSLANLDESVFQQYIDLADSEISNGNGTQNGTQNGTHTNKGTIYLVGAGPGSEGLLTKEALDAVYKADVVLADKLVPSQVIELVPKRTTLHIAKKFPGNAEQAQQELLSLGLAALQQGKTVVRLKQGDPYIFGRGAEEYLYFSQQGYTVKSVAGITSALAALLYANIPATHRGVADQLLICTGTGRAGALPDFPLWDASRTTVFLMALHRIDQVVQTLVEDKHWDINCPCAVIERASCPDQRIIKTTLAHVADAIKENGSRPPGLLVTGYACDVIEKLAPNQKWVVTDGISL